MAFKVDIRTGRLNVSGPNRQIAFTVQGAAENARRGTVEISLTLESLRRLRRTAGLDKTEFARSCTPKVLQWARAAGISEQTVNAVHARIENGWRMQLPWYDNRAGTAAPAGAPEKDVEIVNGARVFKYREPFDHQQVMASVACALDGTAYLCEMGTGKTRAALESIQYQMDQNNVQSVLVLCPNRVMGTWERETAMWTRGIRTIRLGSRYTVAERAQIIAGSRESRTIYLLSYEAMPLKLKRGQPERLSDSVVRWAQGTQNGLCLDEMHKIKNPHAHVTQGVMEVARYARWRLGQTGTPILGGAQDIWSQWYVVDLGTAFGANYVQFKREFFQPENPWTHELAPLDGTLNEIGVRLRRRGLRYRKADCLDLPEKTYEVSEVEMTREQQRAYDEMAEQLITEVGGRSGDAEDDETAVAHASIVLVKYLRLTQITSGFVPTDRGVHFFEQNPKMDATEEMVRDHFRDQKQIIWCRYRYDIEKMAERLRDLNPMILYGGMGENAADEVEKAMQFGDARLLIANPATGGTGLNLYAASLSHYYSQDYRPDHRQQSEDRTHRSGSEMHEKITYVDHMCAETIDFDVRMALMEKKTIAEVVVDLRRRLLAGRGR